MRRIALAVLSLAFLATACQPATTELTEEQKAEIAEEVNALQAEFWDAWREVDVGRGFAYYHDSPDFAVAVEGQLIRGFAALYEIAEAAHAGQASQVITVVESHTTVLAADVVHVMQSATGATTDSAGVTGPETAFAFSAIWMRRDGEWKMLLAHESFPPPEADSM